MDHWKNTFKWVLMTLLVFLAGHALDLEYQNYKSISKSNLNYADQLSKLKSPPPKLEASIAARVVGSNGTNNGLLIILVALHNGIGPMRPLNNWSVSAIFNGEEIKAYPPYLLSGKETTIPGPNGHKVTLEESNYCYVVTEDPLPSGANRSCWLGALFRGRKDEIEHLKFTTVVRFDDVLTGQTITLNEPKDKPANLLEKE